jgi:hypothetical protein
MKLAFEQMAHAEKFPDNRKALTMEVSPRRRHMYPELCYFVSNGLKS